MEKDSKDIIDKKNLAIELLEKERIIKNIEWFMERRKSRNGILSLSSFKERPYKNIKAYKGYEVNININKYYFIYSGFSGGGSSYAPYDPIDDHTRFNSFTFNLFLNDTEVLKIKCLETMSNVPGLGFMSDGVRFQEIKSAKLGGWTREISTYISNLAGEELSAQEIADEKIQNKELEEIDQNFDLGELNKRTIKKNLEKNNTIKELKDLRKILKKNDFVKDSSNNFGIITDIDEEIDDQSKEIFKYTFSVNFINEIRKYEVFLKNSEKKIPLEKVTKKEYEENQNKIKISNKDISFKKSEVINKFLIIYSILYGNGEFNEQHSSFGPTRKNEHSYGNFEGEYSFIKTLSNIFNLSYSPELFSEHGLFSSNDSIIKPSKVFSGHSYPVNFNFSILGDSYNIQLRNDKMKKRDVLYEDNAIHLIFDVNNENILDIDTYYFKIPNNFSNLDENIQFHLASDYLSDYVFNYKLTENMIFKIKEYEKRLINKYYNIRKRDITVEEYQKIEKINEKFPINIKYEKEVVDLAARYSSEDINKRYSGEYKERLLKKKESLREKQKKKAINLKNLENSTKQKHEFLKEFYSPTKNKNLLMFFLAFLILCAIVNLINF